VTEDFKSLLIEKRSKEVLRAGGVTIWPIRYAAVGRRVALRFFENFEKLRKTGFRL
jgi:hypothetical protein